MPGPRSPRRAPALPVPTDDALPENLRYLNLAMKDPLNEGIDPKRIELAIALANIAATAEAEKDNLERQIDSDIDWLWREQYQQAGQPPNILLDSLPLEIADLSGARQIMKDVVAAAQKKWNEYRLGDVTVFLGNNSMDVTHWEGKHRWQDLAKAGNAGMFFPATKTPNTFLMIFDLLTAALPELRVAEAVGAETAEAAAVAGEEAVVEEAGVEDPDRTRASPRARRS